MKNILLFLFLFAVNLSFAQRTSVRSYYRKDGTHVSAHTRGYKAGSGRTSSSRSYSSSYNNDEPLPIIESSLTVEKNSAITNKNTYRFRGRYANVDFMPSTLQVIEGTEVESDSTALPVYFSILRYDGKIIDICPIGKSISSYDFDFDLGSLYHKINKQQISAEHIVELISNCGFKLEGDELRLFMPITTHTSTVARINKTGFLKHTFEVMHVK